LKLTLSSLDEKANILKNKLKVKLAQNPDHIRNLFVTPDLTPLEQRKNIALRHQLADMNKVENIYTIRKRQIVRKHKVSSSAPDSMSVSAPATNDGGGRADS